MKERHHQSPWEDGAGRKHYASLRGRVEADVAVVGAGITGLMAAYLLEQAGLKVVVVEAEHVGAGTTGHTTAHLTAENDHDYFDLQQAHGDEACRQVAASMLEGIALVEGRVHELGIGDSFRRTTGYYFTEGEQGRETIEREYATIERLGLYPVRMVQQIPLPFPVRTGYEVPNQAEMHPMPLLEAMASRIEGGRCRVFEHSHVNEYDDGPRPAIRTDEGEVVADRLILATHTPLGRTALHTQVAPYRSYVIGFTPRSGTAPEGLFWDTADPYHYVRQHRSNGAPMVLVGGEDTRTGHGGEEEAFGALEAYARTRFDVDGIDYRWSAQYYEPADQLPSIGPLPGSRDVYVATGFSGDGITFGALAGHVLARQVLGRKTPWDALYRPARGRMASGGKEFLKENLDVAARFVGDRLERGGGRAVLEQLGRKTGAVVTVDGRQVAAVRDEGGELRLFEPVCPHLGCIVHWNAAQATFDCPCHGSRFDADGRVLEGPARSGLKRLHPDPRSE